MTNSSQAVTPVTYKGLVSEGYFITLAELREKLNFSNGTDFQEAVTWIHVEQDMRQLFIPEQVLCTNVSWKSLSQFDNTIIEIGELRYIVRMLDNNEWDNILGYLIDKGELTEDQLSVKFMNGQGSGTWVLDGTIRGYNGISGEVEVDPLTSTKNYGWRPVLELIK